MWAKHLNLVWIKMLTLQSKSTSWINSKSTQGANCKGEMFLLRTCRMHRLENYTSCGGGIEVERNAEQMLHPLDHIYANYDANITSMWYWRCCI